MNELDARLRYDRALRALDAARIEFELAAVAWQYAIQYCAELYELLETDNKIV